MSPQMDLDPSDPQAVAEDLGAGLDQEPVDDTPTDPISRAWELFMAPSPSPREAGELVADDLTWDMYVSAAIQGMSESHGMPAGVLLLIGLVKLAGGDGGRTARQATDGDSDDSDMPEGRSLDEAMGR